MSHSATPWEVVYGVRRYENTVEGIQSPEKNGVGYSYNICETDSGCYGPKKDDAEYICLCVNNHEALVQVVNAMLHMLPNLIDYKARMEGSLNYDPADDLIILKRAKAVLGEVTP